MTIQELSQLYWLKKEIEQDRRRLAMLDRGQMPAGLPAAADKRETLRRQIEANETRGWTEVLRLNSYIAQTEDCLTRQILTLRYIDGLSWNQVADRVGGGNTEDSVRMAHNRYIRRG